MAKNKDMFENKSLDDIMKFIEDNLKKMSPNELLQKYPGLMWRYRSGKKKGDEFGKLTDFINKKHKEYLASPGVMRGRFKKAGQTIVGELTKKTSRGESKEDIEKFKKKVKATPKEEGLAKTFSEQKKKFKEDLPKKIIIEKFIIPISKRG